MEYLSKRYSNIGLNNFIIYLYVIFCFTPILSKDFNIGLILVVLWFFFLVLNRGARYTLIKSTTNTLLFSWFVYILFLKAIGYSTAGWGIYFRIIMFFFPFIVYNVFVYHATFKEKKRLLIFSILLIFLNLLNNLYLNYKYPGITRELNFSEESIVSSLNIGNTIYSLNWLLFAILMTWLFLYRGYKLISFSMLICALLYPFLAEKTTAIFIMLLAIYFMLVNYFINGKASNGSSKMPFYLFIISIMVAPFFLVGIIGSLDSFAIKMRLISLINLDTASIHFERIRLAELSLNTFFNNPIIGVGHILPNIAGGDFSEIYKYGIGSHSELMDHLARYGLIGFIFYLITYRQYKKSLANLRGYAEFRSLINTILVCFFVFSFLNNSFTSFIGCFMFLVVPLFIEVFSEKNVYDK